MEKITSFKQLKIWQMGIEVVAEGFKRYHDKEYTQFLYIALGSAAELETQCHIAKELGFMEESQLQNISEKMDHLSKMITSLIKKINQ